MLNEIIRDLDDMLSAKDKDPRWKAIQKIKTVGACYMAASGLDPVTEAQTTQVKILGGSEKDREREREKGVKLANDYNHC